MIMNKKSTTQPRFGHQQRQKRMFAKPWKQQHKSNYHITHPLDISVSF